MSLVRMKPFCSNVSPSFNETGFTGREKCGYKLTQTEVDANTQDDERDKE